MVGSVPALVRGPFVVGRRIQGVAVPRKPVSTPLDRTIEELEQNLNVLIEYARSGEEAIKKVAELERILHIQPQDGRV